MTQFDIQECPSVYKWTGFICPFLYIFVWAFILANVSPFQLMWMFHRLIYFLLTSLFAVHIQWVLLLLLSEDTDFLGLISGFVDRASRYNFVKYHVTWCTIYSMKYLTDAVNAVNFIPLLGSLYMFWVFYTSIIKSTIFNRIYSHWCKPQYRLSYLLPLWPTGHAGSK